MKELGEHIIFQQGLRETMLLILQSKLDVPWDVRRFLLRFLVLKFQQTTTAYQELAYHFVQCELGQVTERHGTLPQPLNLPAMLWYIGCDSVADTSVWTAFSSLFRLLSSMAHGKTRILIRIDWPPIFFLHATLAIYVDNVFKFPENSHYLANQIDSLSAL